MIDTDTTKTTVSNYFAMWNEPDPTRRRTLIEKTYAADGRNIDPAADVQGWDQLEQFVSGLLETVPEHTVAICSAIDGHNDRIRFSWAITSPEGEVVLTGIDCVRLANDGRIAELVGFFDGPIPQ